MADSGAIDLRVNHFVWHDPADAAFVGSCRDALKIERKAWEACHAERLKLSDANAIANALLDAMKADYHESLSTEGFYVDTVSPNYVVIDGGGDFVSMLRKAIERVRNG